MAFPLTPAINDYHTESGLRYMWTGSSWDLADALGTYSQVIIESSVDPVTGTDSAPHVGAIWRNSSTGTAFRYEISRNDGSPEWSPVRFVPKITAATTTPLVRDDGRPTRVADIWVDTSTGVLSYCNGGTVWYEITTYFDPTYFNSLPSQLGISNDTENSAVRKLDTVFDALESKANPPKAKFIGTYAPSTNTVNFIETSPYADGTLPAANTLKVTDFLLVVEDAVGQAPAPTVQMYKGDYLVGEPGTNTWVLFQNGLGFSFSNFLSYPDTPGSYTSHAGKALMVDTAETKLEYGTLPSTDYHSYYASSAPITTFDSDMWVNSSNGNESVYSGGQWLSTSPVAVTSSTPPAGASNGTLWYDRDSATLYIYDGSTTPASWVAI